MMSVILNVINSMEIKKIIFLVIFVYSVKCNNNILLCTQDYCNSYPGPADPACPILPPLCNKSDPSSGIFLSSPTPCNCCDFCIAYLAEGAACSTGEKISDSPTEICGPGFFCDSTTEKCIPMKDTACLLAQKQFDENKMIGKIGDYQIRPKCDENGDFVPYHCIPNGVCYCVSKDGKRIFGTVDNNGKAELDLSCTCSRNVLEMSIVLGRDLHPGEYFRCNQNGVYDALQCIDEKTCMCVDEFDGAPTYTDTAPVEMWAISKSTLPCFNSKTHTKGKFYRRCEEIYMNKTRELKDKEDNYDEVLAYQLPECALDGYYAPVQENHKYKFCSTPDGRQIKEYVLEKNSKNKDLLDQMNCKCAMASSIMSSTEKPSCLSNGNFNTTQYRRGAYYTVDEDGNQVIEN